MPEDFSLCQVPFDLVGRLIPDGYDNTPARVTALAVSGSYAVVKLLQYASEKFVDKFIPGFHDNVLPLCERACQVGIPAAVLAYSLHDPSGAWDFINSQALDTYGMALAWGTGAVLAESDIRSRGRPALKILSEMYYGKSDKGIEVTRVLESDEGYHRYAMNCVSEPQNLDNFIPLSPYITPRQLYQLGEGEIGDIHFVGTDSPLHCTSFNPFGQIPEVE